MTFKQSLLAALVFAGCYTPALAHAQEYTRRSFLLPEGTFEITGNPAHPKIMGIGVSDSGYPDPIYIAPHFYWGVSDKVTLGITHRRGLCLNDCYPDRPYNDVGFGMLVYLTSSENFELDLHAGVPIGSFDPFYIGPAVGVLGKLNFGIASFVFDPGVYVALSERKGGNGDWLYLPFWFYFQATNVVVPYVGASLEGPFDDFGGRFVVPVEGGVMFSVSNNVDLGVNFRFHNLLGNDSTVASRELGFMARFRF
jgi:hypothetical protein